MKTAGYPLAGELVLYSLLDWDYYEDDGKFATEIKKTKLYKKIKKKGKTSGSSSFNNGDLFYAIHLFDYQVKYNGDMYIFDTYDFEFMDYENFLLGIVNNYAYLSQHMDVLNKIYVGIFITNTNN